MQVAAMSPVSVSREEVPAHLVEEEYRVAVEKTKEEQVHKAVEAALKKAGINPNLVDSEDHISSNIAKGWLTQEEADKARVVAKEAAEAKAANLPQQMIENIANGRVNKFYKESVLLEQEFVKDAKQTIKSYLESASKGLTVTAFKRFTLNAE
jgi:elongation factor Ts